MRRISIVMLGSLVMLLAGCANPYVTHYKGTRFPHTNTAKRVMTAPDTSTADLIGTSSFSSTVVPGDEAAISAAEQVGANMVQNQCALELPYILSVYMGNHALKSLTAWFQNPCALEGAVLAIILPAFSSNQPCAVGGLCSFILALIS